MSAELRALVDTNVLVYAVVHDDLAKQEVARRIVERGFGEGCYAVSTQVLFETYVTLTRKATIRMPEAEALGYVRSLGSWRVGEMSRDLALAALQLSVEAQISAWDAGILLAARELGCPIVLSEDLGDGRSYGGVKVVNPFARHV